MNGFCTLGTWFAYGLRHTKARPSETWNGNNLLALISLQATLVHLKLYINGICILMAFICSRVGRPIMDWVIADWCI
jgi:hypothetical protein